jgi:SAM-dependent methyltransferase
MPFTEAKPILERMPGLVPNEFRSKTSASVEADWPAWTSRHDTAIRARLDRGDEDSVVNFWLYGTTFTRLPRATAGNVGALGGGEAVGRLIEGRLNDLLGAVATPGANERLQFVRQVLARHGIDPTTPDGRERAWDYLDGVRSRMAADEISYRQAMESVQTSDVDRQRTVSARLYAERGLSSDTGMPVGFSLERILADLASAGEMAPGSIRRVAIVGPGLDFTDKAEGYDFYPVQSIQPFALIDSLLRLNLASAGSLVLTTLDISARVTGHLEAARDRVARGDTYVLHVPLDRDAPSHQWQPALVAYWQRFGDRIGAPVAGVPLPAGLERVRVRAIGVRPEIVRAVVPRDLNVVVERLEPLPDNQRFDLVVATNILVYYDAFEQALALGNISSMLRPGGFLITSDVVSPVAPMDTTAARTTTVERDRQGTRDVLFAYERH